MELILWRHAEAADTKPDSKRQLTAKGKKHAAAMGRWLRRPAAKERIRLVSPALRAQQTARALSRKFKTVKGAGASATTRKLIAESGWPKGDGTIVIVGHQPALGEVAAFLLSRTKQSWSIKKGGLIWIEYRARNGTQALMRAVMSPDLL